MTRLQRGLSAAAFNLAVYRRLLGVQIRSQMQYRAAFLLDFIGTAISLGLYFVSLALIIQRFGDLAGWTLGESAEVYPNLVSYMHAVYQRESQILRVRLSFYVPDPPGYRRIEEVHLERGYPCDAIERLLEAAGFADVRLFRSFDPDAPEDAEVPDPYYGGREGFVRVLEMVEAAAEGIADHAARVLGRAPERR